MRREEYITDSQVVKRAQAAVKLELEKQKALDNPLVIYDAKTGIIYHENSDGSRVAIGKRRKEGRFSEQFAKKA
ncbi:MAG: hypothetical protein IJ958_05080 [Agathobacter sp.]|nr:hypothetical protein [Agathobacter sp.]